MKPLIQHIILGIGTSMLLSACIQTTALKSSSAVATPIITPSISLQKSPQAEADIQQHLAVSIITASHYCQNKEWPSSIRNIRRYQAKNKLTLPVTINWKNLQASTSGKQLIIQSRAADNSATITSTHTPPLCSSKNIQTQVSVAVK